MPVRQVTLDTETTGLDPKLGHRIIEIAAVEIIDRRITNNVFQCYLNPQRTCDPAAVKIHGITDDFLRDKPLFNEVVNDFLAFIRDDTLIIHNAPFDLGFIHHELQLSRHAVRQINKRSNIIDTLILARQEFPGQRNSLDALCKRFHVDLSERQLHGALLDCQLLAKVYLAMTGGQGSLFGENATKKDNNQTEIATATGRIRAHDLPLVVVNASQEEQKEHKSYCQEVIQKSSGHCLWEMEKI
jgi:DNA polymerase III subunit epsilon